MQDANALLAVSQSVLLGVLLSWSQHSAALASTRIIVSKTLCEISKTLSKTHFLADRLAVPVPFASKINNLFIQQDQQDGRFK